jgi:hypothetical protein
MSIPAYPLQWPDGWPRVKYRKSGNFGKQKTTYGEAGSAWKSKTDLTMADAMARVAYELDRLGINVRDDSIVSTNLRLNLSGLPRGDQGEPGDPGVAVYFQKKNGPMRVIAIDAYTRVRDNVAAIAATLEAMRAIERHGGAQILERAFTGFAALTAPGKSWWDVLEIKPDASREVIEDNFRRLAFVRHPDRGGDHTKMAELNEARDAALRARA